LLTGCASKSFNKAAEKVDANKADWARLAEATKAKETAQITYLDSSFIPLRRLERQDYSREQREMLDFQIETNRRFANLSEVAVWLTSVTSAAVHINPELMSNQQFTSQGMQGAPMTGIPAGQGVQGLSGIMPGGFATGAMNAGMGGMGAGMGGGMGGVPAVMAAATKPLQLNFSGSIQNFLDAVAANYSIYWRLEGRSIRLYLIESKTFRIKALPGDTQLNATVTAASNTDSSGSSSGGSSGTSSGANTQGASTNATGISFSGLNVWTGMEDAIKQMLTPVLGKVVASPATGTLTVTDTPRQLEKISALIEEQNAALSRQVALNVRVLSVEVTDSANYGINWNAVYNNLADNVAFRVTSALPTATNAAQFVLQTSTPSGNSWGAASGAVISALSTQGRVSELTSATMVTLNNQPAPVNVGRQVSYLASSSSTVTANAGATTALQPGKIQTGFSMVVLPHIIDGKELLLQSSINISSLLQLTTITSGASSIQSPDVSTSNFIQRVKLNSGDLLIMSGFDQDNLSAVANGVGQATNPFLGSRSNSGTKKQLVVLVQPTVSQ
jgi:type IVB pilus formation R64 PilN family outer membrane protein